MTDLIILIMTPEFEQNETVLNFFISIVFGFGLVSFILRKIRQSIDLRHVINRVKIV